MEKWQDKGKPLLNNVSLQRRKTIPLFGYVNDMMDVNYTYCGNISQYMEVIMLYSLIQHNARC